MTFFHVLTTGFDIVRTDLQNNYRKITENKPQLLKDLIKVVD
jgi:hypothetical protein